MAKLFTLSNRADEYHRHLWRARPFLESRGVDRDSAIDFRLGFVETPFPGDDQMAGRLSVPYLNAAGGVNDLRFRCVSDHVCKLVGCAKYLSRPGASPKLYNSRACATGSLQTMLVCEGELDTIVASRVLCVPAVGVPGVATWRKSPHWAVILSAFPQVLVLADGDDAGRELAKQVVRDVSSANAIVMPGGEDVSSVVRSRGEAFLVGLVTGRGAS